MERSSLGWSASRSRNTASPPRPSGPSARRWKNFCRWMRPRCPTSTATGSTSTVVSRRASRKTRPDAYFLDANVLIYAAGGPHSLREPCRAALEAAVNRRVSLVTDSEVLQEILYRYSSIERLDIARDVYSAATELCDEVFPVTEQTTGRARELLHQYGSLSAPDEIRKTQ